MRIRSPCTSTHTFHPFLHTCTRDTLNQPVHSCCAVWSQRNPVRVSGHSLTGFWRILFDTCFPCFSACFLTNFLVRNPFIYDHRRKWMILFDLFAFDRLNWRYAFVASQMCNKVALSKWHAAERMEHGFGSHILLIETERRDRCLLQMLKQQQQRGRERERKRYIVSANTQAAETGRSSGRFSYLCNHFFVQEAGREIEQAAVKESGKMINIC